MPPCCHHCLPSCSAVTVSTACFFGRENWWLVALQDYFLKRAVTPALAKCILPFSLVFPKDTWKTSLSTARTAGVLKKKKLYFLLSANIIFSCSLALPSKLSDISWLFSSGPQPAFWICKISISGINIQKWTRQVQFMAISAAKFLALQQWNDLNSHYVPIAALNILFFFAMRPFPKEWLHNK